MKTADCSCWLCCFMLGYKFPGGEWIPSLHSDWGEAELHCPGESGEGVMKFVFCSPVWGGVGMKAYMFCCIMPGWPCCCCICCWVSGKSNDWILWCEAPLMAAKCVGEVGRFIPLGLIGEVWCIICWCGEVTLPCGDKELVDWTDWGGDIMGDIWGLYVILAGMDCCLKWACCCCCCWCCCCWLLKKWDSCWAFCSPVAMDWVWCKDCS